MTSLAILHPGTLLGKELRQRLEGHPQLAAERLRLLTTRVDEAGLLTEAAGAAAVVTRFAPDDLAGIDLAFFCGTIAETRPLLADLPSETTAIVLAPDATRGDGLPVVAGINLDAAMAGQVLVSPHPGAVALAHLLHPLRELGLEQAVATLVQPASIQEEAGLHELFEQTRSILAFAAQPPSPTFRHQLAFNLLPTAGVSDPVVGQLGALLGEEVRVALQIVKGSVFHGFSLSVHTTFGTDPGAGAIRSALRASPVVEIFDRPDFLGPIDAAQSEQVLLGHVHADPRQAGAYWLWATMDNLTAGGALNALAIAEAVLG